MVTLVIEQRYDDLAHMNGVKVLAQHVVTLIVRENDTERTVTLDLSDENHALLQNDLQLWFKAGQSSELRPPSEPKPLPVPRTPSPRNLRMRKFADDNNINYKTATGDVYYTPKLKRLFAAYEKENPLEIPSESPGGRLTDA